VDEEVGVSDNPVSGRRPYEGRDEPPRDEDTLPGEQPLGEDEREVQPPGEPEQPSGHSTRAAAGAMPADQGDDVVMSGGPGGSAGPSDIGTPESAGAEQDERARGE
jgi:hypothetical protein